MRLRLRLENWQLFEALELETRYPVTIVTGANAAGKTALRDSFEFILAGTGVLRGIKTKQALAFESIRDGASATSCFLQFGQGLASDLFYGREMGRDGAQKVRIGRDVYTVSKGDERIREFLKVEPDRIRAALEADHVLAGDEKARRALIVAVSGAEATRQEVLEALMRTGLPADEIERLANRAMKDGFDAAKAVAETERTNRTRIIRREAAEPPKRNFQPSWATQPIDLEENALETLRKREADLDERISEADRADGADRGRLEQALEDAQTLERRLLDARAAFAKEIEAEPEEIARVLAARLASAQAEADEKARVVVEADDRVEAAGTALEGLREDIAACGSGAPTRPEICPAIAGRPPCGMTDAKLRAHAKKLAGREAEIRGRITLAETEFATARAAREVARSEEQTAAVALRAVRNAEEAATRNAGELVLARKAVENAEAALADAPEAKAEAPRGDFFRTRLERCRALIRVKEGYEEGKAKAEAAAHERAKAETERTSWDTAAKIFAPDGLATEVLAKRTPALQAFLDELDIAQIRITTAGEFETFHSGRWRGRRTLSESWQLRLSVAASHVIGRASGFPVLVVDRFDHLDGAGRIDVLRGLLRVAKFYHGGVLVLATLGKKEPTPAGVEGVETIWLRDGETERIG